MPNTALLEASLGQVSRVGILSPEAQDLVDILQASVLRALQEQYSQLPMARILAIFGRMVRAQESELDDQLEKVLGDWTTETGVALQRALEQGMEDAALLGWSGTLDEFVREFDIIDIISNPVTNVLPPSLLEDIAKNAGSLVSDLNDTTIKAISGIISDGVEKGLGVEDIAQRLLDFTDDDQLTEARALLIARTEVNDALSDAGLKAALAVGVDEHSWSTVGDDRVSELICRPNEGQGRIPIKRSFQSGHKRTPGHPN